jgi:UTP--glucose-1-phosphate uridylyltransferase
MDSFARLFDRYLEQKTGPCLDWSLVNGPQADKVLPYASLSEPQDAGEIQAMLGKLAVIKLNGGLGTTMGCVGPKSAIEVRDGMSFLDLTVRQMQFLNETYEVDVPLILMNSFNTDAETGKIIQKYGKDRVRILTFNQSRFPRINKDSLSPVPAGAGDAKEAWYPPGHGDVYDALSHSGLLDDLLKGGVEYVFVSNIDNLGATVDTAILKHLMGSGSDFIMEVTDKTKADIKGGTLVDYNGQVRLLEIAQVPHEHKTDFTSIKKFKIFNTNNIWLRLGAVKGLLEAGQMDLEVIVNEKVVERSGEKVIQLETAVGAAIKHFRSGHGVNVPRRRFLPVKSCSDLFLVQSDLYTLSHGILHLTSKRPFGSGLPLVKLGDAFKKVPSYLKRFAGSVRIAELDHLTVTGDVTFGKDVVLKGTVIIVANHGSRIDIPAGAVLEDKVVSGSLHILDH